MLVSLGVENFRSFKKKTDIVLKPITVLVGKNSSGKSSFLRLFPLFRQSIEVNTMGPILWFGQYVDFGNINNVIFKESEEKYIKFYFDLEISRRDKDFFYLLDSPLNVKKQKKINVELTIEPSKQQTQYKSINLSFRGIKVSITNQKKGIIYTFQYNDEPIITEEFAGFFLEKQKNHSILPSIYPDSNSVSGKKYRSIKKLGNDILLIRGISILDFTDLLFTDLLIEKFKEYSLNEENDDKQIYFLLCKLTLDDLNKKSLLTFLKEGFGEQDTFITNIKNNYNEIYIDLLQKITFVKLNSIMNGINEMLYKSFSRIRYMAPIRAIAERFYRFQDLQVNEMDHTGSNVAMILNSLCNQDKLSFKKWVKDNFHFSVAIEVSGSHYTINIIDENGIKYNISDMGFGYSQLLPIIVSLWIETEKKKKGDYRFIDDYRFNKELLFVIEQPELHLHPAYQTQLAKLFSKIISNAREFNIKIIVETHSQYFINALGESVEEKQISKDDISIIIFNKNNKETDIQEAHFDEEGILENWPIGFFSGE